MSVEEGEGNSACATHLLFQSPVLERDLNESLTGGSDGSRMLGRDFFMTVPLTFLSADFKFSYPIIVDS